MLVCVLPPEKDQRRGPGLTARVRKKQADRVGGAASQTPNEENHLFRGIGPSDPKAKGVGLLV